MSRLNEIEHTADRAFRIRGKDLRELFTHAADALLRLEGQPVTKSPELIREVEVEGIDRETLLVNWLNEIHPDELLVVRLPAKHGRINSNLTL